MKNLGQKTKWILGAIFTILGLILLCFGGLSIVALFIWQISSTWEIETWLVNLYELWSWISLVEPSNKGFEEFTLLLPKVILVALCLGIVGYWLFGKGQKLSE